MMTLKILEIELYCWQNDYLCQCVLEDVFSVCQPSQMERRRCLLYSEDQILALVGPPCPLATFQSLPHVCMSVCVWIHLLLNDWHQQTGIPVRAPSSLTTCLLFVMGESAAVSPLSLFTQWFPEFRLFESCSLYYFSCLNWNPLEAISCILLLAFTPSSVHCHQTGLCLSLPYCQPS